MARIRSIHPGLFTDETFAPLSCDAQILYIGLLTEADDQGIFEWKPSTIRMRIRPTKDGDVAILLAELEAADRVRSYELKGRKYGAIRNFRKYQRPKKPNSVHPMPDEFRTYTYISDDSSEPGAVKPASVPQKSEIAPQREDGGWRREEESPHSPPKLASLGYPPKFEALRAAFPSRGKAANPPKPALKAWNGAIKRGADPDELIRLAPTAAAPDKHGTEFVPMLSTWLNQDRWKQAKNQAETSSSEPAGETPETLYAMARVYLCVDPVGDGKSWKPKRPEQRYWAFDQCGPGKPGCIVPDEYFQRVAKDYGAEWAPQ